MFMTHNLSLEQMQTVTAGGKIDAFCLGVDAVAGVYALGLWANWWNPVGWTAGTIGGIIGGACLIYQLR